MSVYVDETKQYASGSWCHMIADNEDELHEFARCIGLRPEWFQASSIPHYDLRPSKRERAIAHGAIPLDERAYAKRVLALHVTNRRG